MTEDITKLRKQISTLTNRAAKLLAEFKRTTKGTDESSEAWAAFIRCEDEILEAQRKLAELEEG